MLASLSSSKGFPVEFHHVGVFKAPQAHDGVSNQSSLAREKQQEGGKRNPKKEKKTNNPSSTKKKSVTMKMFSIAAAFFLLTTQGATCSEAADDGPIIGKDHMLLLPRIDRLFS